MIGSILEAREPTCRIPICKQVARRKQLFFWNLLPLPRFVKAKQNKGMGVSLIIVSNRVAEFSEDAPVEGGLASALSHAVKKSGAVWIGTKPCPNVDRKRKPLLELRRTGEGSIGRVDVPEDMYQRYYAGFANSALWPILHSRPDLIRTDAQDYAAYREINKQMASALSWVARPDSQIWVHDYHFLTVGEELRRLGADFPIGFFLHTPFPAWTTLPALPHHRDLVRAMLEFQLIGFQTDGDRRNFAEYVKHELGLSLTSDFVVSKTGTRLGCFPVGVDARSFARNAVKAVAEPDIARLRAGLQNTKLIIGVDRIDYSKGIGNRLRALDLLLETSPQLRRRISFLQIALPSRSQIEVYGNLQSELAQRVSDINGRHGEVDWTPIRYLTKGFAQSKLAGLYRSARVGLVTPLFDGMNLIAKEYVAAQDPADPGVLVLSEFAGSARQLRAAVIVNPHDIDGMAHAIRRAVDMPLDERRERWASMMAVIEKASIHDWYSRFMAAFSAAVLAQEPPVPSILLPSAMVVADGHAGESVARKPHPERAAQ
jgi:trehalose 6-phosphate synthase